MKGIVLFGHGSRAADYLRPFEQIKAQMLARQPAALVALGFLELSRPSFEEAIESLHQLGATQISVVPIFFGPGRHVQKDLPQLAANALARYPDLSIHLCPPVGEIPEVIAAMADFALSH